MSLARPTRRWRFGAAGSVLLASAATAGPVLWQQAGSEMRSSGEARGVSITGDGTVTLAPALLQSFESGSSRLWSMVATPAAVYYAAAEDGRVWRQPLAGGDSEVILDRGDLAAQAMAVAPDGTVFVAFGPGGLIYRLEGGQPAPQAVPWAQLQQRYVWAMAVDGQGRLVVATGDDGRILRLDATGAAETLYDSPEPHVTALALGDDGAIFAGTEGSAYVYRIGGDGDVRVLLDAAHREITGLLLVGADLWVAAAGADTPVAPAAGADTSAAPATTGKTGSGEAGAVYRVDPDGLVDSMWGSAEAAPYALAATPAGVVAGTGPQARLLALSAEPGVWGLIVDLQEGQVVALAGGERLLAGMSGPGRIVQFGAGHRPAGTLQSVVRDTGATSRFGVLRWAADAPAGTAVRLRTRSGNSGVPDDTWSDWSAVLTDAENSRVSSPPARFLQWQAELSSSDPAASPRLRRVEVAYVPHNRRPRIDTLTVHPAGVVYRDNAGFEDGLPFAQLPAAVARQLRDSGGEGASAASAGRAFLGRAYFVAGLRTVSWEASDPDFDSLVYDVQVRPETGEAPWMTVVSATPAASQVIDTRKLPDGHYQVRVRVSDAPSWAATDALQADRAVTGVVVDNTAPVAVGFDAVRDGGKARVRGQFADRGSLIVDLQYSLDGGAWTTVGAADGAADSTIEDVDIELTGLEDGPHVVMVRAVDSSLNEATVRIEVAPR